MIAENKNSTNVFNKMATRQMDGRQDFAKNGLSFAKKMDSNQLNFAKIDDQKITSLNDWELFSLCQKYGEQARIWRQKFAGLLPEVLKRRLYERKGFESIFVFAKKLAGMSEEQVRRVLNLEQKFEDKPVLKNLLLNGEVSANKLARIASIATPENQEFLANQAKILSNRALETLVKDEKFAQETLNNNLQNSIGVGNQNSSQIQLRILIQNGEPENKKGSPENANGLQEPLFDHKSVHVHTQTTDLFEDVKLLEKFSPELKEKLKELDEKGLDINQIMLELLQKRDEEIAMEKEQIGEEIVKAQLMQQQAMDTKKQAASAQEKSKSELPTKKPSHYINVKIKNLLKKEHGDKCSIPGCNKPATTIHHTQRFTLSRNNDPRFLAPFCEQHHEIAHSIDQKYQQKRALAIAA